MNSLMIEGEPKDGLSSAANDAASAESRLPPPTKISWIHHSDFDRHESIHDILESLPETQLSGSGKQAQIIGKEYSLPNQPLLNAKSERILFLQMNLLRCLAARRQQEDLRVPPSQHAQKAIDRLLEDADRARNKIIEANQRLVVSNAARFQRGSVPLADLVSEANLILVKAIDNFDVSRGYRLSTYATHAIRRHLGRYVQREQKRAPLYSEELCEPWVEEESAEWIDVHPGELAKQILAKLPEREREIVEMRFGLNSSGKPKTLDKIGQHFGISKERVRQLVARCCAEAFGTHAKKLGIA